jgi:hypothetical protein
LMATSDYAQWLQRRTNPHAGGPADRRDIVLPPRGIRESARGGCALPSGEMLWRLGLSDEAIAAWRDAAQIEPRFLAARLAWRRACSHARTRRAAQAAASEALALAPLELRRPHGAAAAALGDRALAKLVSLLPRIPNFRCCRPIHRRWRARSNTRRATRCVKTSWRSWCRERQRCRRPCWR